MDPRHEYEGGNGDGCQYSSAHGGECALPKDHPIHDIPRTTLREMCRESFQIAVEHGWAEKPVPIPEQCMLIVTEAAEAMESYRNGEAVSWTDPAGKPQGVGSEFADILIRIGHYCMLNGIDLEYEYRRKCEYNKTRPYRHGGKLA